MFTVFYVDENDENAISTDNVFEDSIETDVERRVNFFDRFIYLACMYRIIVDCSKDFEVFRVEKKQEFWRVNKYLLNYVNSIYSFKEYIRNCYGKDSSTYKIVDRYFEKGEWFTFICNYRNRIIHQSTVIKDYDMKTGEVYICLEELIDAAKQQMNENNKVNDSSKRFIRFVESQFVHAVENNGKHFVSAKAVVGYANSEIRKMSNNIFSELFENEIKQCLEWFLSTILCGKEKYYDTYLIQDETKRRIRINFFIEDYLINLLFLLGKDFDVVKSWISLLKINNYTIFYTQKKSLIDDVVDATISIMQD